MKKILAVLLMVVMLLTSITAFQEEESVTRVLTNEISRLLEVREHNYWLLTQALKAWNAFVSSNTYTDLVRARAAIAESKMKLARLHPPTSGLTPDERALLASAGIEVDALDMAIVEITQDMELLIPTTLDKYESYAALDWMRLSNLPMLASDIEARLLWEDYEHEYVSLWVNYLLLPVKDDPLAMEFWASLRRRWPLIGTDREWMDSAEAIETRLEELVGYQSVTDQLLTEHSRLLGQASYALWQVGNEDLEQALADLNIPSGSPAILPLPEWFHPGQYTLLPSDLNEGTHMPFTIFLRANIDEALPFFLYLEQLKSYGLEVYNTVIGEDDRMIIHLIPSFVDSLVTLIIDTDFSVTIAYYPDALTLEPSLYYELARRSAAD